MHNSVRNPSCDGEEVLAAAELRAVVGRFPVLEHAGVSGSAATSSAQPAKPPRARGESASTTTHPCSVKCAVAASNSVRVTESTVAM